MKRNVIQKAIMVLTVIGTLTVLSLTGYGVFSIIKHSTAKDDAGIEVKPTEVYQITETDVMEIIQPAADLITMKDSYMVHESYEKHRELLGFAVPFTSDETFLAFSCEIGVGFDLEEVDVNIDRRRERITLTLPDAEVKYNEIDMDHAYLKNVKNSWLITTEDQELIQVMADFQNQKEAEYLADGTVFRKAENHAEDILEELLKASDVTGEYDIFIN